MSIDQWVFIDTCMWVPYFARGRSPTKDAVDSLLEEDRAALIGPVLAEILCGFRKDSEADWVASALKGLHFLDMNWDDWRAAARLTRRLTARGHSIPLTDCALAAVAQRHKATIFTIDPHFDLVPQLKWYRVE